MTDVACRYRLLGTALPTEEKRIRTSYLPTLILALAVPTAVGVALGISKGATPKSMMIYSLAMTVYIACLAVWYPRRVKRQLIRCWETYELEVGQDYLLRRQANIPDLRLQFNEVRAVEHVKGRYLRVIGKSKGRVIVIPEALDQFSEVLKTISSLRPVRVRTIEQWQKYRVFMIAGLLFFVIMLWSTSPFIVVPLSLATSSLIVWVFYWFRRNPNVSESSKRVVWIYWLFFAMCVVKLFASMEGTEKGAAIRPKIFGSMLLFSPGVLVILGWMRWSRERIARYWRNDAIAWGLATASLSALCLYGVISYVHLKNIGRTNEHRLAMAGAYVGFPLAFFSVLSATLGKGRSRGILWLAGGSLAVVWSFVFFYA
jgi:membrane protein YdbS with pleckstrin-like domain